MKKSVHPTICLLQLLLLLFLTAPSGWTQIHKPNYELRNDDFQLHRQSPNGFTNYAKAYFNAYQNIEREYSLGKTEANWTPLGPMGKELLSGTGRVNNLTFHPTDSNTWYICVAQGGVWKTTNAGESWISISSNLPILRTSALAINPLDPDIMYLAVGDFAYLGHNIYANENKRNSHYGLGVYKTRDGGQSWYPTGLSFNQLDFEGSLIGDILIHPNDTSRLVAIGETGVYTSSNGGESWSHTNDKVFWDIKPSPTNPNTLLATTGYVHAYHYGYASIQKSNDFGQTWKQVQVSIPDSGMVQRIELAIAPSDPNYVYAVACDTLSGFFGFYKSTNGGESFALVTDSTYKYNILNWQFDKSRGGQGRYDLAICVNKVNKDNVFVGGVNVWQTKNGGKDFIPVTYWSLNYMGLSLHADCHMLLQHPTNNSLFACHDGGLSRTFAVHDENIEDLKQQIVHTEWKHYTNGLNITSFYRISINEANTLEKIAGAQDNSTVYTDGISFENISGGDGMESEFIPQSDILYTSSQNGRLYVFNIKNGTERWFAGNITPPSGEFGEWTTPFVEGNNLLYVLYGNLHSYYGKSRISTLSNFPDAPRRTYPKLGTALDVERNRIYLAKRGWTSQNIENEVWTSSDGGDTWEEIHDSLPRFSYPSYIHMNHRNTNEVWLCFSNFDTEQKVYHSNDGGKNWSNVTYNLPNIPVNCIVHQNDQSGLVYVGTDLGVYYLPKDSTKWQPFSKQLPNVIVSELEIDYSNKKLVAATFGRGIWETDLLTLDDQQVTVRDLKEDSIQVTIYPNPVEESIRINFHKPSQKNYFIRLIDITGKTVHEAEISTQQKGLEHELSSQSLLPGEYFLIIESVDGRHVHRFIKT